MICVPIAEPNVDAARHTILGIAARADLVELRVDQFDDIPNAEELAELLRERPCPVIITCRPEKEGGRHDWPDDIRLNILQSAIELGADYVDVELPLAGRLTRRPRTRIIVSHHDFNATPLDLKTIYDQIVAAGADVAKIATFAQSLLDNIRLFDILRKAAIPTIGLCMGELGLISRVLGRKFGSMLTYAPVDRAHATAPGQITLDDIINLYNYRSINRATAIYGVIGNPIAHSVSPHIHNAAFRSLGINAVYVPFKVEGDVRTFIDACRGLPVSGYSVTIPHKEAIIGAIDEIDSISRSIGAVNTVINNKGRLAGSNTDWSAAIEAIETALDGQPLSACKVALVGAGGTAKAISFGLKAKSADTIIYNRTAERAEKLSQETGFPCAPLDALAGAEPDIIINTTSVGMYPNVEDTPVPASILRRGMIVFDTVYNPVWTRLLCDAEEAGCTTVNGLVMFVNQAVQQFKTWTGLQAPRELMETVTKERLSMFD